MVGLGVNVVVIIAGVFVFEKRLSFVCLGEEKDRSITVIISACGVVGYTYTFTRHTHVLTLVVRLWAGTPGSDTGDTGPTFFKEKPLEDILSFFQSRVNFQYLVFKFTT